MLELKKVTLSFSVTPDYVLAIATNAGWTPPDELAILEHEDGTSPEEMYASAEAWMTKHLTQVLANEAQEAVQKHQLAQLLESQELMRKQVATASEQVSTGLFKSISVSVVDVTVPTG